jgi:molybdenum cofactor synthesis domain-containing protein
MVELNLLEKTELWITDLLLEGADLTRIAQTVADALRVEREKVLVVDVREDHITLDILKGVLRAEDFFGKERDILARIAAIPGVRVGADSRVHSDGILGMIALDEAEVPAVLEKTAEMRETITSKIARRACVFPTGFEVKRGMIKDTNSPFIEAFLGDRGFSVVRGEILDDDKDMIAGKLQRAIDSGFGLVITTGGVGAESKDRTVEAVLAVDPEAETPYIAHFTQGTGRHEKDGVRIAVGRVGESFIVALPGPNDEVRLALNELDAALKEGLEKKRLSAGIARALRQKLKGETHGQEHAHDHR